MEIFIDGFGEDYHHPRLSLPRILGSPISRNLIILIYIVVFRKMGQMGLPTNMPSPPPHTPLHTKSHWHNFYV